MGYVPDVILRFCSNWQFVSGHFCQDMENVIREHKIPIVNSLSASFYGYRGYLSIIAEELPDMFPNQYLFEGKVDDEILSSFPWLKLEAAGFEYVVNYSQLRKWAREALINFLNGDFAKFDRLISGRNSGDANNLRQVKKVLETIPKEQVFWLGQENLEPLSTKLKVGGKEEEVRFLHRVYWLDNGSEVKVSMEGFGCLEFQFKSSKGKMNAGTGFSVPIKIVR